MAKGKTDEDTGITPKATDGDPGDMTNEVAQRAALRAAREAEAERVTSGGKPIDEQDAPTGEEDDGQMFVWEQGSKVTLGTLISRGTPVEHAFVFGGKRLKGRGGLMGHNDEVLVVVRGIVGKTSIVPVRDEQERVTRVTIETHIASKVVVPANSDEAIGLLQTVLEERGLKAA